MPQLHFLEHHFGRLLAVMATYSPFRLDRLRLGPTLRVDYAFYGVKFLLVVQLEGLRALDRLAKRKSCLDVAFNDFVLPPVHSH